MAEENPGGRLNETTDGVSESFSDPHDGVPTVVSEDDTEPPHEEHAL